MNNPTIDLEAAGKVAFETYVESMYLTADVKPEHKALWDNTDADGRDAWTRTAAAVIAEYDRQLVADANDRADGTGPYAVTAAELGPPRPYAGSQATYSPVLGSGPDLGDDPDGDLEEQAALVASRGLIQQPQAAESFPEHPAVALAKARAIEEQERASQAAATQDGAS